MVAVLAVDFGTSGVKAGVVTRGTVAHTVEAGYPTSDTQQDPADWLTALRQVTSQLPQDYDVVSLTGQMQDLIQLDADYQPLGPAILYTDTRAAVQAEEIHRQLPNWNEWTGNEQSATSNVAMLAHTDHDPAHIVFGPAGFVAALLGLGALVDSTTASTTGFYHLEHRAWIPELAHPALPQIVDGLVGTASDNDLGIPAGTPVVLAPGDAGSTTLGLSDSGYVYLGTSGWFAAVTEDRPDWPGSFHRLALPGGAQLSIAAVKSAGGTAEWARRELLGGLDPASADALITRRGWSGIVALPSLHGERFPLIDASLSLTFTGIRDHHTRADVYQSVLESVALALAVAVPRSDEVLPVTGGGARSQAWVSIIADVTGRPVAALPEVQATLLGAAAEAERALGGVGVPAVTETSIIEPDAAATHSYAEALAQQAQLFEAFRA